MAKLRKVLSFSQIVMFGVGIIVGAGIYSIIGDAAAFAGYGIWLSVLIAGIITILTGLCFSEMAGMYPKTSGYYKLISEAFKVFGGKIWGFNVEWMLLLAAIFSIGTVGVAFSGYLVHFLPIDPLLATLLAIVLMGITAYIGVKESVNAVIVATIIELAGLSLFIILGLGFTPSKFDQLLNFSLGPNVYLAAALIFFAYTGFELIPTQSEETKLARRFVPKAIMISVLASMAIYMAVVFSITNLVDPKNLAGSTAPLSDALKDRFGSNVTSFIGITALFATISTVLGMIIAGSRLLYGISREKMLPKMFSKISRFRTPHLAIALVTIAGAVSVFFLKDLTFLAELANIFTLITFVMISASVFILRYYRPKIPRVFTVPLTIKNISILSLVAMLAVGFMIHQFPLEIKFYAIIFTIVGILLYLAFKVKKIIE